MKKITTIVISALMILTMMSNNAVLVFSSFLSQNDLLSQLFHCFIVFACCWFPFVFGMMILYLKQKMSFSGAVFTAGIGALLGTVTELFSPSEYDTVTVPIVFAATLLILTIKSQSFKTLFMIIGDNHGTENEKRISNAPMCLI